MTETPLERSETADAPEPDDALRGTAAETADHDPADSDDRVVEIDEPEQPQAPVDDEDRDPGRNPEASPGTPT